MSQNIYTFSLDLTMKLMSAISRVDRFDASWSQIEKREGQTLKQLKAIATVRSVGASTRIEGSKMTDEEVRVLIEKLDVSKLEERDEQEVVGYFEVLDTIAESYRDIDITEGNLKNLHKILMRYSAKDEWHRGGYKQITNEVEATHQDGTKATVFKTTEPGLATEEAMAKLIEWYHADTTTLPIVKVSLFVYDFLSIHPFQDGNGRLSRLLATLLLLRNGYSWIQYVSFEHEIESRKAEYYRVLMQTQRQRPGEPVDEWLAFFLDCLLNIQAQLTYKLNRTAEAAMYLAPREKNILAYIENHPGSKSGEIAEKLNIPLPTVKKILATMVENKAIVKYGIGVGTKYVVEPIGPVKTDLMFQLTNDKLKKEFLLMSPKSFIEIKKIILTPLFAWTMPTEWGVKFHGQQIMIQVKVTTKSGASSAKLYSLGAYDSPHYFQPIFTLHQPIIIEAEPIIDRMPPLSDYPLRVEIDLRAAVHIIDFDITFVYDER